MERKEELGRQYAEAKVRKSPENLYKGYHLHRQMELTRFDGYDIQQAFGTALTQETPKQVISGIKLRQNGPKKDERFLLPTKTDISSDSGSMKATDSSALLIRHCCYISDPLICGHTQMQCFIPSRRKEYDRL